MGDGLSQIERRWRIESLKPFAVTESNMQALLRQAEDIAGMIRYVDSKGEYAGFFDEFLNELKIIRKYDSIPYLSGDMEPSQALIYSFLHHLHEILQVFNNRWKTLHSHYFNNILQIVSLEPKPDKTWISFAKSTPGDIILPAETRFTYNKSNPQNSIYYRLAEKMVVTDIIIDQAYSLHFVKSTDVSPASLLKIPVALKKTDLLADKQESRMLFDETGSPEITQPLGIQISSPSLLLREGRRNVSLSFQVENLLPFNNILNELVEHCQESETGLTRKETYRLLTNKLLKDIFHLKISTANGWEAIANIGIKLISLKRNKDTSGHSLIISFELPDDFPATTACNLSVHQIETKYPALSILLNRNSWLYSYHWIKHVRINKVKIKTRVSGVSNIMFFNELGRIDNSSPFPPFGTNTERGAYFTIGNFEMALKNVENADVLIRWQQLPDNKNGLSDYYDGYNQLIDNRSFRLQPQYLTDYKWKRTPGQESVFLFSTKTKDQDGSPMPDRQLSDENLLSRIDLREMKPLNITEDEYDYNILSESGFFRFILEEPDMGFGEKQYRTLFSEQIIKRALKKSKNKLLNPPITPLIERITLSYTSVDIIDMIVRKNNDCSSVLSHIYPSGRKQVYPNDKNEAVPFLHSLDTDANILLGLRNVKGDETICLYFDFFKQNEIKSSMEIPTIQWYWGDGYYWRKLPDDSVYKDTTKIFFTSGQINIYIPEIPERNFRDKNGLVWLRAGIIDKKESISGIKQIRTNVVEVYRDKPFLTETLDEDYTLNASEINIPGIDKIEQIAPFSGGIAEENETDKAVRISEYVSHRGKAITTRDYERIVLCAFPDICKVKCLCNYDAKLSREKIGEITLVVMPEVSNASSSIYPRIASGRLLEIKNYLENRISIAISEIDVINPVYEQILVRCNLRFDKINHPETSDAAIRTGIRNNINKLIAPWQHDGGTPILNYSFTVGQLYHQISEIPEVKDIEYLSVIQVYMDGNGKYDIQEYTEGTEIISPKLRQAVLVPARKHTIVVQEPNNSEIEETGFGINNMEINENFIICR